MARELTQHEMLVLFRQMDVGQHVSYLRSKELLLSQLPCSTCGIEMSERPKRTVDGCCWVCDNRACAKYRSTKSIRHGSFFAAFKLPIIDVFSVIFLWAENKAFCDIAKDLNMNHMTISKIIKRLREKIQDHLINAPIKLGGPGKVCQIDESLFLHKVKYNRGRRPSEQVWVFGIADISRSPSRFFLSVVPDGSARTLFPIISAVCLPGTTIHSDCWAAYLRISSDLGYEHETVNHSLNFVNPETGVHTQNVESLWNRVKRKIKSMCGIRRDQLPGFLAETMFRSEHRDSLISGLVTLLKAL